MNTDQKGALQTMMQVKPDGVPREPQRTRMGTGSRVYRRRTTATPPHATGMMADVSIFPLL